MPTFKTQMEYKPATVTHEEEDEESGEDPPMSPMEEDEAPESKKTEEVSSDKEGVEAESQKEEVQSELKSEPDDLQNDSQNKENVENVKEIQENGISNQLSIEKSNKPEDHDGKLEKEKAKSSSQSSSSSRHKHKKNSSHKSSHSEKPKSSSSSSKRPSSSSESRKHSERKEKERSSSHHKSSRNKSSSSSKDRNHSKSSSSSKSKHSSSSSSTKKSKDRDKEKPEKDKKEKKKAPSPIIDIPISDVDVSSDEDAVMQQCKLIFEEYQPEQIEASTAVPDLSISFESVDDDLSAKKRVAYEGAVKPLIQIPARNTKLNTMQQIYNRQEAIRKMLEAQKAAKAPEQATSSSSSQMAITPIKPRPSITPVSNILAFKHAKEKIEAFKQVRKAIPSTSTQPSSSSTIAQTSSKFYGRKAHINKVTPEIKPAPPVLEPTSNKISYNLRMQYYNMMVKHCLVIYPNCEDGWQRAQTEELAVLKKCNTANIYKSSALLTVNKLRKEAIEAGNTDVDK